MLTRRFCILSILLLVGVSVTKAQYDPSFSHYYDMETSFNPSAAGRQAYLNVAAAYAMDMAGYEHNPRTAYVSADIPFRALRSFHGVGVNFMNDQIGLFTHTKLNLQYAFQMPLFKGHLRLGAEVGFISEKFDGSQVDLGDSSDPAFSTADLTGSSIDLGAGLFYTHGQWYGGASVHHLNSPLVSLGDNNELKILPTYYFTGGGNISFRNPFITLKPSLLFRTDGTGWRGDITGRLVYNNGDKMLYIGATYSPTVSATILLGGSFHGVVLGYSYEVYTSSINPGNGSHELFVGYRHDISFAKKGRNLHKSVRIL
uniref:PorP/SprF family type IX secretion system membrane protein n=1 Tax=Prevotella sp. TaxID=59823 RepID=UPI004026B376